MILASEQLSGKITLRKIHKTLPVWCYKVGSYFNKERWQVIM